MQNEADFLLERNRRILLTGGRELRGLKGKGTMEVEIRQWRNRIRIWSSNKEGRRKDWINGTLEEDEKDGERGWKEGKRERGWRGWRIREENKMMENQRRKQDGESKKKTRWRIKENKMENGVKMENEGGRNCVNRQWGKDGLMNGILIQAILRRIYADWRVWFQCQQLCFLNRVLLLNQAFQWCLEILLCTPSEEQTKHVFSYKRKNGKGRTEQKQRDWKGKKNTTKYNRIHDARMDDGKYIQHSDWKGTQSELGTRLIPLSESERERMREREKQWVNGCKKDWGQTWMHVSRSGWKKTHEWMSDSSQQVN